MLIDGIAYLLTTENRGSEYVLRYTGGEMAELFTQPSASSLSRARR